MLESYWSDLLDPKDPLIHYRKKGWDRFEEIGLPKPKQEAFQYLTKKLAFPKLAEEKDRSFFKKETRNGLVFVDGFFEDSLSLIPSPIVCMGLAEALRTYGLFLQNRLALSINQEKDPFAALNGAFLGRGAFLYIPPNCKAALHLHQIYTAEELTSSRLHIYLGKNSSLEITSESEGKSGFSNNCIDIVLDSGANCAWIDRASGDFQAIRASLKRDSKIKAVLLGSFLRNSIRMELLEEAAQAELFGLARLEETEEAHIHVHIEHAAPYTHSNQHIKSVLKDKARFSFEGKIYIHPEAQKTQSYQLNNNLILSDEASANAKPNLEIFADDVKASHGATTGRLDEEALFYFRSRGLSLEQAKAWLIEGFCKEIIDHAQ